MMRKAIRGRYGVRLKQLRRFIIRERNLRKPLPLYEDFGTVIGDEETHMMHSKSDDILSLPEV
ncbi:MAG: hypothetical protein ACFFFC_03875 [Candidatus Thorarchaeota archaeon]